MVTMDVQIQRSESDLSVFISSVMDDDLNPARDLAVQAIETIDFGRPWAFEYTPASSEAASDAYLRKVEEADFVIWLVGRRTTQPVVNEINRCIATHGRLLVFKLPAQERDEQTEILLQTVGKRVKWQEVDLLSTLETHIKMAISDEIIRRLRDPHGIARTQHLERTRDRSFAACEVVFLALGVSADIASKLANDINVGKVLDALDPGLHVVIGDQGSGKTLASRRLLQLSIERALEDSSEPFPIFIEARDIQGSLWETIDSRCQGYVDSQVQAVIVIIDGVDEIGASEANSLLQQMETYVRANPKTIAVVTTRLLPGMKSELPTIPMPTLDDEQIVALIQMVSGREAQTINPQFWESSLKESLKFPLFALMIGVRLRQNSEVLGLSGYKLVEHLAQAALEESSGNSEETDRLLQVLATKAITYGTRVRPYEVALSIAQQRQLTDSRLVHQTSNGVDFALPIFREWYAARAILEGTVAIEDIDLTSERWAIPLSIVVHSDHADTAQSVMRHLASTNPSLAADVLKDDESSWYRGGTAPSLPATAVGVGEEIRQAMDMWARGVGPLFKVIGPVNEKGELSTLGVKIDGTWLTRSWYGGDEQLAPVVEFTESYDPLRQESDWKSSMGWPSWSVSGIPPTELWSWVITKNHLVRNLSESLKELRLSYVAPDAIRELIWEFALTISNQGSLYQGPIAIRGMLERIQQFPPEPVRLLFPMGRNYSRREIDIIQEQLTNLLIQGHDNIYDPWPVADLSPSTPSRWSRYTEQRLLERTSAIYAAALRIYEMLARQWFAPFAERLRLYRLMPVNLAGELSHIQHSPRGTPSLSYRPIILPVGEECRVAFELGHSPFSYEDMKRYFQEQSEAFARLRGGDAQSAPLFRISFSRLDEPTARPATELAHEWLSDELRGLGWVDR